MSDVAYPYVNWGRWIADCPRLALGCSNREHYGRDANTGHLGGLTDTSFRCAHCGLACRVEWPKDRAAIDALLAARPVPATRNWLPGEPLESLVAENMQHGLIAVGGS